MNTTTTQSSKGIQNMITTAIEKQISMFNTDLIAPSFDWPQMIKYFNFLTQMSPEDQKLWQFDFSPNGDPDDGFLPGRTGGIYDNKSVFQFRPRILEIAFNKKAPFIEMPGVVSFLETLNTYHRYFYEFFCKIMKELDMMYPEYDFVNNIPLDQNEAVVIRLLKYPKGMEVENRILAKEHFDKSFSTIHITETAPGLFLGERLHIPFKSQTGKVGFFFSTKAPILTGGQLFYRRVSTTNGRSTPKYIIDSIDGGLLTATKHVVLSTAETLLNERFSVVVFLHSKTDLPVPNIDNIIF